MPADRRHLDWSVTSTAPDAASGPDELSPSATWLAAPCPGTAASAWRAAGLWSEDADVDFDALDWWFRTSFAGDADQPTVVHFDGIATLSDVWLDGVHVLHSENMFLAHEVVVPPGERHELVVVCRSIEAWLATRRPRGRWKTRLVAQQQLRWVRTTLLGRMPSWQPRTAPVGLWRDVRLVEPGPRLAHVRIATRIDRAGDADGSVDVSAGVVSQQPLVGATLLVAGARGPLEVRQADGGRSIHGSLRVAQPRRWWPVTHGEPVLHPAAVELVFADGSTMDVSLGSVGFRSIEVDTADGAFGVNINGVDVFCRGACWVPIDPVAVSSSSDQLRHALGQMVAGGMNMVRITGTMVYEQDEFYELCDELGLLVWQDLMFANMDYPVDDEVFVDTVTAEVDQLLARLGGHPCLAVVCGGSEVEQQAAMMGLDPAETAHRFGAELLATLVAKATPGLAYVQNSPSGGALPFAVASGISHYYGVGAYRRPLADARRASVRFTTECLAFANVGCREALEPYIDAGDGPGHSPRWKQGVPRDRGAGWDFEDVRDHYVRELFGVDPFETRAVDPDRYLDLGRAAVAVAIESTLGEWRTDASSCRGALLFTMRDLASGAGWGVVDAVGRPKSAYHAAARANAPVAVWLTDEGLDGVNAHVANDRPTPLDAELRVRLFDLAGHATSTVSHDVHLSAHGSQRLSVGALLGGFHDLTSAYRFGPQMIDVVSVQLVGSDGVLGEATFLPGGHARARHPDVGLKADVQRIDDGVVDVRVRTRLFAHFVSIDAPGHDADANWFHLAPGDERSLRLTARPATSGLRPPLMDLGALNAHARLAVRLPV